jgi:hypothetical protein
MQYGIYVPQWPAYHWYCYVSCPRSARAIARGLARGGIAAIILERRLGDPDLRGTINVDDLGKWRRVEPGHEKHEAREKEVANER